MPISSVEKGGQELATAWLRRGSSKLATTNATTPLRLQPRPPHPGPGAGPSGNIPFHSETQRGFYRA